MLFGRELFNKSVWIILNLVICFNIFLLPSNGDWNTVEIKNKLFIFVMPLTGLSELLNLFLPILLYTLFIWIKCIWILFAIKRWSPIKPLEVIDWASLNVLLQNLKYINIHSFSYIIIIINRQTGFSLLSWVQQNHISEFAMRNDFSRTSAVCWVENCFFCRT